MDREKIRNKSTLVSDKRKIEHLVNTMILQAINTGKHNEKNYNERNQRIEFNTPQVKELIDLRTLLRDKLINSDDVIFEYNAKDRDDSSKLNKPCKFMWSLNAVLACCYFDSDIKVRHIASSLAMSERQLSRKLRLLINVSPGAYIRKFRLDRARILLSQGRAISYVALDVGFNSHAYFSRCFKAQFGKLPSEYKKNL